MYIYMYMKVTQKTRPIAEARRELPSLVHEVEEGATVELTRRGKPVAVLLSVREYAALRGASRDLWPALQRFRDGADLEALDIEDVYRDTRDRSLGRPIDL